MKRYGLAVMLGVLFGLGLAIFPNNGVASFGEKQELALVTQPQRLNVQDFAGFALLDLKAGMIGIVIGAVIAVSVFFVAVRRAR